MVPSGNLCTIGEVAFTINQSGRAFQNGLTLSGVFLHDASLFHGMPARLEQDMIGCRHFADVVQKCRNPERLQFLRRQSQRLAQQQRQHGHVDRMHPGPVSRGLGQQADRRFGLPQHVTHQGVHQLTAYGSRVLGLVRDPIQHPPVLPDGGIELFVTPGQTVVLGPDLLPMLAPLPLLVILRSAGLFR